MASLGRGMILQNMKNNTLEKEKQIGSKKLAMKATFGRGTSSSGLMTPSQFMKNSTASGSSSSNTAVKSPSPSSGIEDASKKSPTTSPKINQRLKDMLLNDEKTKKETYELINEENKEETESSVKETINPPKLEKSEVKSDEKSDEKSTPEATETKTESFISNNDDIQVPENEELVKKVESCSSVASEKRADNDTTVLRSDDVDLVEESNVPTELVVSDNNFPEIEIENYVVHSEEKPIKSKEIFCTKEKVQERSEDEKWKLYQVERKITKIIKSITMQNLGEMFEELESLIEERPLSSRFMNCSEVELLLQALMKNAVQNAEFLPLAPCLIKMVAEHQPIEFKHFFPDIIEERYRESVTLSASDDLLNKLGQHFCRVIGNLFAMPRQTGNTLFDLISPIVEEFVEKWTIPDGTKVESEGLNESKLMMEATAVKYLLLEITNKMLPCDREVEMAMEKFVWFLRESVLNASVPKNIREIYLDGLIEVQTTSGEDGMSVSASAFEILTASNSQTESDADVYFESDSCYEDAVPTIEDPRPIVTVKPTNESEKEAPQGDINLDNIELPKFDTIAMAPTIENAFDTSGTIPKASVSKKNSGNSKPSVIAIDDSDADVIIEDDDDEDEASGVKPLPSIFLPLPATKQETFSNNSTNEAYTPTVFPKKKLPLGRGRGLARLPDYGSGVNQDKPVANVNPINYSSSESSQSDNRYSLCNDDLSDLKNKRSQQQSSSAGNSFQNQNRTNSQPQQQQRGRFNNGPTTYTGGYGNSNNNDNNRTAGGLGSGFFNDRRASNFQNNNNNSRNYNNNNNRNNQRGNSNRNRNSSDNNNWRDRNPNTQNRKKMNFRPTNHSRNTMRDEQFQNAGSGSPNMARSQRDEHANMEKVYHPNGRLEYKPKQTEMFGFGDVFPNRCLRCDSDEHNSDECTIKNFFF